MATDSTDNIGGHYKHHGPIITCILEEGNATITATGSVYDAVGTTSAVVSNATPLARGNMVAISNDVDCTWAATDGLPVMEKAVNAESFTVGRIISEPKWVNVPTVSNTDLADRLSGGYFRTALVEIYAGITAILKAEVYLDGSNGWEVGQTAALHHNITGDYADDNTVEIQLVSAADTGTGIIAFHYGANGTAGDQLNCLVGINGVLYSVTGA